jgi:hypothetical protein
MDKNFINEIPTWRYDTGCINASGIGRVKKL